ncbi:Dam family site-specific DNA-(adenine-N6)-methyltransferase [Macrococcoides canis]|uniref:Dam family site-specific DNA-(adenine-N6)-methyltransferase n=1 Tax=Macrococcoides canis TaxID=1855823 RepID=UPI001F33836C|nr:Dam family site-specific DNA-(adenine-N6)-methyltransferase [Macrococcus canis]UJS27806.1 Dam family site-specific DNA-(adenine-N6)-methyltransferase [Macrococcus canis]
MRYLGNKTQLLNFIESTIEKYNIQGESFADIFAGTSSVGDYFKGEYKIIANDYLYFSSIISKAKLMNASIPRFDKFIKLYNCSPFEYLNAKEYHADESYFVYNNYSLPSDRMYFTPENAIKIDGIRMDIEEFLKDNIINKSEYYFLLASLLECVTKVSNTTGTYQAFLKYWESRSLKLLFLKPLDLNVTLSMDCNNVVYNENANKLARKIEGDIVYIDPPYTTTQYINSYHVLETIAKYDYPEIFGITGRRKNREFSNYSNKGKALAEFEDLLRQLCFKNILISYSNHSIIKLEELISLCESFAINGEVFVEYNNYRSYATNNLSHKEKVQPLTEVIIYFKKDNQINKSPLNYSGSKDKIMKNITRVLPKQIDTFVDMMGGAFNVGANVVARKKVIYNEYNPFIFEIINLLLNESPCNLISEIKEVVEEFNLEKKNKESYINLRNKYNISKDPLLLYILQIYSFQNMIRFNNKYEMNVPVGNNEFNKGTISRIKNFKPKTKSIELLNLSFEEIDIKQYSENTIFYFDPPYFITQAEYNDGKRGLKGWSIEEEMKLLNFMTNINNNGHKFILSNILYHGEKTHNVLIEWVKEHGFNIIEVGLTGIKYPRLEVLITNYES